MLAAAHLDAPAAPLLIAGKFRISVEIASGSSGCIHRGFNVETGEAVAVKFEPVRSSRLRLMHEVNLCKRLGDVDGIPRVHWYGVEDNYTVAVFELLGPSLQDLFDYSGGRFHLKVVLMLAEQMISRIEHVSSNGLIHRNIKPGHFVMGLGAKANLVHLIGFGLAEELRKPTTKNHANASKSSSVVGALRYISRNAHLGAKQSQKDDLESLGYVLMHFLRGNLPWQGLQANTRHEKYKLIMEKKKNTSVEELCKDAPKELVDFCAYSRSLSSEETPDYEFLKRSLKQLFIREGFRCGSPFHWRALTREPDDKDDERNNFCCASCECPELRSA
eukprot:TRINITY_DN11564_c0_g1_i1.p1 TRINITY_DN11564_c0_g1~~TRINITY_DN11564_c0_g1_i1.p1  ORF type:complete len:347 (-),score=50.28 TRINITY_DN11564_c0_g1_i1:70-1065(-)